MQSNRAYTNVWYGWIPILTETPLFSISANDAYEAKLPVSSNHTYILEASFADGETEDFDDDAVTRAFSQDFTKAVRKFLKLRNQDKMLCYLRTLDGDRTHFREAKRIVITLDDDSRIKRLAILDIDSSTLDASARITISPEGLVRITLLTRHENIDILTWVKHIFFNVRDFYHEHIYGSETDSLLQPVNAKNRDEAVARISMQFQEKIPDYHSKIIRSLSLLSHPLTANFPNLVAITSSYINSAKGEMIHALAFGSLFRVRKSFHHSIGCALSSFDNLRGELDTVAATKYSSASSAFNAVAVLLTLLSTFFVIRQLFYSYLIMKNPSVIDTMPLFWRSITVAVISMLGVFPLLHIIHRWKRL